MLFFVIIFYRFVIDLGLFLLLQNSSEIVENCFKIRRESRHSIFVVFWLNFWCFFDGKVDSTSLFSCADVDALPYMQILKKHRKTNGFSYFFAFCAIETPWFSDIKIDQKCVKYMIKINIKFGLICVTKIITKSMKNRWKMF